MYKGYIVEKPKRGRKPKDEVVREERLTIKLSKEEVEKISEMAEYLEIPKTVFARNLILQGLSDAKLFRNIGLLQIAKGVVKTSDFLKQWQKITSEKKVQN